MIVGSGIHKRMVRMCMYVIQSVCESVVMRVPQLHIVIFFLDF